MKMLQKCLIFSLMLFMRLLVSCKNDFQYKELESSYFVGNWEWDNAFTPTTMIKHKLILNSNGTGKMTSPNGLIITEDGRLSNIEWVFNKTDSTLLINQEKYKIIEHEKKYFVWKKDGENSQMVMRK